MSLSEEKYRRQMIDTTITLLPLLVMAYYYYGLRVVVMAGLSVLAAAAADYFCLLLQKERWWKKYDYTPLITGLTFVLMLPASAPYWLVIFGALFAIIVIRHPFGGHYNTLFNPALTSFAFLIICWNSLVTQYPAAFTKLPLTPTVETPLFNSPAYLLMLGGSNNISLLDALLGNFNGPMGTTCIAVLLCCGLYLTVRKTILWQIPVATFSIVAFFAWFFPRINGSRLVSVLMELTSGVLVFSIIFIAAMDNGEIQTCAGKWICGCLLGGFIVLFRHLSNIELVAPFAVILMNALDARCDSYAAHISRILSRVFQLVWHWSRFCGKAVVKAISWAIQQTVALLNRWINGNNGGKPSC